jgi:hypothetical protein
VIVVGIDAMVLVYAGIVPDKKADPKLSELNVRARRLFDQLVSESAQIILPTIVVSELLVPVPVADAGKLLRTCLQIA